MSEIVLPRLGWNMEEGVFLGWLKREGEFVKVGEPLFTFEGDKSVQEIEATESGILRIAANGPKSGDVIPVGTVIGHLESKDATSQTAVPHATSARVVQTAAIEKPLIRTENVPAIRVSDAPRRRAISPRARRIAREHNIDIDQITGTGSKGRIRERDVLAATATKPIVVEKSLSQRMTPLRRTIAQRMSHSARTTAPVTLHTTVDATNLVNLREQFKTTAATTDLIVPSFTDFFIKLTAITLQIHPDLNARWGDEGIETLSSIHIGVAVDTDAGLLVPVVRDVPELSMRQLATQTKSLIDKARTRKLSPDELQGGTFTITNLGSFGIDGFTPIINWPECAILGLGAIRKQPMVVNDELVARHGITLSLTFDHRVVDGAPAARFLQTLSRRIENPLVWLV